ncbi:MAG: glycosyltransferase family 39 protein [Anaerolineae bacterium]|nr:glycosyltransferase family 39 protein [Anaerolineae bacterium]
MNLPDPNPSPKTVIAGLIAFLWLGLLAGGYFWAHNPFGMETVTAVTTSFLNIAVWLGLTWLSAALGLMVLTWLKAADDDALGQLILATSSGLGLLAILVAFLGFAGLFHPLAAWGLVLVLAVVTFKSWRKLAQILKQALTWPQPQNNLQRLVLFFGTVVLLLTFLETLAPIVAWDSLAYHLVGPKLYIEAGRFVHPLNIPQLGFPLLGQMHFTLGMLLVGDGVTPLFHFSYGLLTIGLTVVLARRAFSRETAWMAALVLFSIPTFFTLMGWPYVDITLMFYTTAVFYVFYLWSQNKQTGWLVVLGMMFGFSGGLKYTAVATPIAITISLIWISRRDGILEIVKRLIIIGGVALLLVSPWLLENYITTGNPVYPFMFNDAKFWDDWWAWWYDMPGTGLATTAPWRLLTAPLEATIAGTEGSDFYEATIGPFILGILFLLPFVWGKFSRREKQMSAFMLLVIAVNLLLWLNGLARTALLLRARFLFLIFGVTAVLDGLILVRMRRFKTPQLDTPWLIQTVLALTLILMLVSELLTFVVINPLPAVLGIESRSHYLTRRLGEYQTVIEEGVNQLPAESAIQFFWEPRTYDCAKHVVCHPDLILGEFLHLTQGLEYDADDIATAWQNQGITHVLLYQGGLDFMLDAAETNPIGGSIRAEDLQILQDLQNDHLHQLETWQDVYVLYELKP